MLEDKHTSPAAHEAPPSLCQVGGIVDTSSTQSPAIPTHTAFITPKPPGLRLLACPSPQSRLTENHGQVMTPSETIPLPVPCSDTARVSPGGSKQTTAGPSTPGSGGAFEGKFISSISPLLACQAQARPPPVCHWALLTQMSTVKGALHLPPGASCRPAQGLCRNVPYWPLARTKIATPSELPKLDWILHHAIGHGGCS